MSHLQHRSLKYEYELYVEREIEDYKDSIPRSAILSIGDEAVSRLRAQEQVAFDELVLWAEVDRIITSRLRIPSTAGRNIGECALTHRWSARSRRVRKPTCWSRAPEFPNPLSIWPRTVAPSRRSGMRLTSSNAS